jgi:NADPH2:quinone reductase
MKAAVYYQPGGPEVFRYEDVPDPGLTPAGVLVRVEAISLEGGDTLHRAAGEMPATPHIVGYQAAGTVLAVGDQVSGFAAGDRAVTVGTEGSHAELRVVIDRSFPLSQAAADAYLESRQAFGRVLLVP